MLRHSAGTVGCQFVLFSSASNQWKKYGAKKHANSGSESENQAEMCDVMTDPNINVLSSLNLPDE